MQHPKTIVFDFDGTLVSKDTYYEFNKWLIQNSILRTAALLIFFPIMLPLICSSYTRKLGLNIGSFIAIAFQPHSLFNLRHRFINHYFSGAGAVAYNDGIRELQEHQGNGKEVAIISGCPRWLLTGVTKHLGIKNVTIIGSELKVKNRSLLFIDHCYGKNKLKMALACGLHPSLWVVGYSDSKADIPMLQACAEKVLVNVPKNKLEGFKKYLQGPIHTRVWGHTSTSSRR